MKKLSLCGIILGMTIVSGCAMLPPPVNAIQSPKLNTKGMAQSKEAIVQQFLPTGAKLLPIIKEGKSILEKDIDGDNQKEIIFSFKDTKAFGNAGLAILKKENKNWVKILQKDESGLQVDRIDFADVDGDKKNEMLISFFIGASAGDEVSIYSVNKSGFKLLATEACNKMDISDIPDQYGKKDGKAELALWMHDSGEAYFVDVWRFNGSKFTQATDAYPGYFKKVAQYYEKLVGNKVDGMSPYIYWHLADAYLKSLQYDKALKAVDTTAQLKKKAKMGPEDYPEDNKLTLIKTEALKKINKK